MTPGCLSVFSAWACSPSFGSLQALAEGGDALAQVLHQARNLAAAAEQDENDGQDDQPMPNTKATHFGLSSGCIAGGLSQNDLGAATSRCALFRLNYGRISLWIFTFPGT